MVKGRVSYHPAYVYGSGIDKTATCRICGAVLTVRAAYSLSDMPLDVQMLSHAKGAHYDHESVGYDLNIACVARATVKRKPKPVAPIAPSETTEQTTKV